eukprot:TRINITY_DN9508_c0_g2_i1.p1 TRINITY_DN9508_c0_g2~~TRINITY_DN9508_c0_g2_i1.p1  ORF type:complete len:327 (-),score=52.72 TRINITY_DN9508_c0_g2_i1:92-1072(-)
MLPSGFFHCCTRDEEDPSELQVINLSSDVMESLPVHSLTELDALDVSWTAQKSSTGERPRTLVKDTARQQNIKDRVVLPNLVKYPIPPGYSTDDSEEFLENELLRIYQEFVVDLHKGMCMTQLTGIQEYAVMHLQIMEDLETLKVDQGNGCVVEFPLVCVSKVHRMIKCHEEWANQANTGSPHLSLLPVEHVVMLEFLQRRLAFVFTEDVPAQRFKICMELLVRRAIERRRKVETTFPCRKPKEEYKPKRKKPAVLSNVASRMPVESLGQLAAEAGDDDVDFTVSLGGAPKPCPSKTQGADSDNKPPVSRTDERSGKAHRFRTTRV